MIIALRTLSVVFLLAGLAFGAHSVRFNDSFLIALLAYAFGFAALLVWPWGYKAGDKFKRSTAADTARMFKKFRETL
jgi:hypothetical protein